MLEIKKLKNFKIQENTYFRKLRNFSEYVGLEIYKKF